MKNLYLFTLQFFLFFTNLTDGVSIFPVCKEHQQEIWKIRDEAGESIYEAHKKGKLFRPSYTYTARDAAHESVGWSRTYTEFSAVFKSFMSYCLPEGIPALSQGEAKMTDRFLEMYNYCITKHANLAARYERGKFILTMGYIKIV